MQFLHRSYELRRAYIEKNNLEAYRLLQYEESELPVAIDVYKDNAVIHLFEAVPEAARKSIEEELKKFLNVRAFFYKDRMKRDPSAPTSGAFGMTTPPTLLRDEKKDPSSGARPDFGMTILEYGAKFLINLSDYRDTGLFLDHRETRQWIASQARDKVILNTFAYTGSFSVQAALGGALKTYSVDLSRTYCDWIKKNLALNNLPPEKNWVYKMDTLEFFNYARRKKLSFDIIIIDPPTFSRNKGTSFSVQKDHPALIEAALPLLTPSGFILFSNNYEEFEMKIDPLPGTRPGIGMTVEDISHKTTPPDFAHAFAHNCFIIRP